MEENILKKSILILTLIFITLLGFASNLETLFFGVLNEDSSYTKSLESYNEVLDNYEKINQFYIPDISFGLDYETSSSSITNGDNGFDFDIDFLEVYGVTMGINIPFVINQESENVIEADNINLKLSVNDVFSDEKADNLKIEASYLDSYFSLIKAEYEVFSDLLESVSNYHYYNECKKIAERNLELLQLELESEIDEDTIDDLKKQILEQRKQILEYDQQLISINLNEYSDELYLEVVELIEEINEYEIEIDLEERLDVVAQELRVEAEKLINQTWYKPYLPEFSVNFGVNDFTDFSWNVGFQFSFDIFNRDSSLEAEERKSNYESLKLAELIQENKNSYSIDLLAIESSEISLEISELSLEELKEEMNKNKKLFDSGFINSVDYEISENDYKKGLLEYQKSIESLYIKKMDLYLYSNLILEIDFFELNEHLKGEENE